MYKIELAFAQLSDFDSSYGRTVCSTVSWVIIAFLRKQNIQMIKSQVKNKKLLLKMKYQSKYVKYLFEMWSKKGHTIGKVRKVCHNILQHKDTPVAFPNSWQWSMLTESVLSCLFRCQCKNSVIRSWTKLSFSIFYKSIAKEMKNSSVSGSHCTALTQQSNHNYLWINNQYRRWGLFVESPRNFSGPKIHL